MRKPTASWPIGSLLYHLVWFVAVCIVSFVCLPPESFARDLSELVSEHADVSMELSADVSGNAVRISDRSVTLTSGKSQPRRIISSGDDPLFMVSKGGKLTLRGVQISSPARATTNEQALLFIDGGDVELYDCTISSEWKFGIYLRGGSLKMQNCDVRGPVFGISASEGARIEIDGSLLTGSASTSISLRGNETLATITNSRIEASRQGLSASDGARAIISATAMAAFSDAAVFLDGAIASIKDSTLSGIDKVGIYADGSSRVEIEGTALSGPSKTAINLNSVSHCEIVGTTIRDAAVGLYADTAVQNLTLREVRLFSGDPSATHIYSNALSTTVAMSWFFGAGTAIAWDKGKDFSVDSTYFAGQAKAAIEMRNAGENASGMALTDSIFFTDEVAIAVNDQRGQSTISDSIFVHFGTGLIVTPSTLESTRLNSFLGASEITAFSHSGPTSSIPLANWIVEPQVLADIWSRTNTALVDTDFSTYEAFDVFATLIPPLQAALVEREDTYGLAKFELSGAALPPATHVRIAGLTRVERDGTAIDLGEITKQQLPLTVLSGTYQLQTSVGIKEVRLGPNESHELNFARATGPYALLSDGGELSVGPAFELLPQDRIASLVESWWPGSEPRRPPAVPREGVGTEVATASIVFAREQVATVFSALSALPAGVEWNQLSEDSRNSVSKLQYTILPQTSGILSAIGAAADAEENYARFKSLSRHPTLYSSRQFLAIAVDIWLRLGMLRQSPAFTDMQMLSGKENLDKLPALAVALGQAGISEAVEIMIEDLAEKRRGSQWERSLAEQGFELISAEQNASVMQLSRDVVGQFEIYSRAYLSDDKKPAFVDGIPVMTAFAQAFLHVAAFGTDDERKSLEIGLPPWEISTRIAPALSKPQTIFGHYLGNLAALHPLYDVGAVTQPICALGAGRQEAELGSILADAGNQIRIHFQRHEVEDAELVAGNLISVGQSFCRAEPSVLRFLKNPNSSDPSLLPIHMRYAYRPPIDFLDIKEGGSVEYVDEYLFDSMPDARFSQLNSIEALAQSAAFQRYLHYRAVASKSDAIWTEKFSSLDDKRIIVEPVRDAKEPTPQYWISAVVNLAPRLSKTRRLFGISLQTAFYNNESLAGLITQNAAAIQLMQSNFGRELIDSVVLRHGQDKTSLEFVQTTESGVHVFELPEGPVSDANLIIDVNLVTLEHDGEKLRRRTVSFPLYKSPFGFRQMRRYGKLSLNQSGGQ